MIHCLGTAALSEWHATLARAMDSHFEAVGFKVGSDDEFAALAERAVQRGTEIAADGELRYVCWAPGAGVELWAQLDGDELIGLAPHFAGAARMRAGVTHEVFLPKATPLDGTLHGWADPPADKAVEGDYPFLFDVPDLRRRSIVLPTVVPVQLAAFAAILDVFADDDAFAASQPEDAPRHAPESFIPVGLIGDEPAAEALFHGHVQRAERLTNPDTGDAFSHLVVKTLGGEVDVLTGPAELAELPAEGAVVRVGGWLSGALPG